MTQATNAAQGPVERMLAMDQASRQFGIELLEHGEGTAALRMTVTAAMVNGHRIAHGGCLFLLCRHRVRLRLQQPRSGDRRRRSRHRLRRPRT